MDGPDVVSDSFASVGCLDFLEHARKELRGPCVRAHRPRTLDVALAEPVLTGLPRDESFDTAQQLLNVTGCAKRLLQRPGVETGKPTLQLLALLLSFAVSEALFEERCELAIILVAQKHRLLSHTASPPFGL